MLSYLFALAKLRNAPFYVFDEVDAALDEKNRAAVNDLIGRAFATSQVLVVSHHKVRGVPPAEWSANFAAGTAGGGSQSNFSHHDSGRFKGILTVGGTVACCGLDSNNETARCTVHARSRASPSR